MKIYTNYNEAEYTCPSMGECLEYIKNNCHKHTSEYGTNTIIYWIEFDSEKALCEITYHYPTDTLHLVFTGNYGELCGSHEFMHQL